MRGYCTPYDSDEILFVILPSHCQSGPTLYVIFYISYYSAQCASFENNAMQNISIHLQVMCNAVRCNFSTCLYVFLLLVLARAILLLSACHLQPYLTYAIPRHTQALFCLNGGSCLRLNKANDLKEFVLHSSCRE